MPDIEIKIPASSIGARAIAFGDPDGVATFASAENPVPVALGDQVSVEKGQQSITAFTIPNGFSQPAAGIDLGVARPVGIFTPAALNSTTMTFQASPDGVTWSNVYDGTGAEKTITMAAGRYILLSPADFYGMRYVKPRMGTSGAPSNATADRVFQLVAEA